MQYIDYGRGIVYAQGSNSCGTWERAASSLIGVLGHNAIQMPEIVYKCKSKLSGFPKTKLLAEGNF